MNKTILRISILAAALLCVLYVMAYAQYPSVQKHPIAVEGMPICSQCHPDKWPQMDHKPGWAKTHRFPAAQDSQVCSVCHAESFCSDCHTVQDELKASDKHKDAPERWFPHRGDYLSQHMIDGKINPAECFRCHGRRNNDRCKACHR